MAHPIKRPEEHRGNAPDTGDAKRQCSLAGQ